jgi:hypothetical protein
VAQRLEGENAVHRVRRGASDLRGDHHRRAGLLGSVDEVEGVETLYVGAVRALRLRHDVEELGGAIDHRCSGDCAGRALGAGIGGCRLAAARSRFAVAARGGEEQSDADEVRAW